MRCSFNSIWIGQIMLSLIVLAAGKSTRMPGRNKLLVEIDGKPMVRRVVEHALNAKVDEVVVVLGWEADKIRETLADLPCRFVVNADYPEGQSSSVRAGLREVEERAEAVLILPGDVAMIDTRSINIVIDEYNNSRNLIVVASFSGKPGHPILFSKELFKEIAQISEEKFGLKAVVAVHETDVRMVETGSEYVLRDVDTPNDLTRLK
jgi:molybdenum cofactor cytidylyltransferase